MSKLGQQLIGGIVGVLFIALPATAQELYFPPAQGEWETVDPASVGWDSARLDAALEVAGQRRSSSVFVLHGGRVLAERHWPMTDAPAGYANYVTGQDTEGRVIEDVASAQKSVVAILTGIAQERGLLSIDEPVSKYLGAGWSKSEPGHENEISIRHLLSMTSGLKDDLTFEANPGTQWRYNTPAYHMLMRVVVAAANLDRDTITRDWLTLPLGMNDTSWTPRPWASADIGVGLSTSASDLARMGLMMQAGGKWGETTIIGDKEYLDDMLSPSQSLNPAYGYLWWLNGQAFSLGAGPRAPRSDGAMITSAPADLLAMQGAGDRKLYLVPSLNLIVTRLGFQGTLDGEGFNDAFWKALAAAAPR